MSLSRVKWSRVRFRDLESIGNYDSPDAQLGARERTMRSRWEDIMCFIESDRLWPPVATVHHKFDPAFREVLARLPQRAFDSVLFRISFIVEDPSIGMLAVNVPAPVCADSRHGIDTIVFYHTSWKLSQGALVGLVAHEIAHSFVRGKDYRDDERRVTAKVCSWGFGKELAVLRAEKLAMVQHKRPNRPTKRKRPTSPKTETVT